MSAEILIHLGVEIVESCNKACYIFIFKDVSPLILSILLQLFLQLPLQLLRYDRRQQIKTISIALTHYMHYSNVTQRLCVPLLL